MEKKQAPKRLRTCRYGGGKVRNLTWHTCWARVRRSMRPRRVECDQSICRSRGIGSQKLTILIWLSGPTDCRRRKTLKYGQKKTAQWAKPIA